MYGAPFVVECCLLGDKYIDIHPNKTKNPRRYWIDGKRYQPHFPKMTATNLFAAMFASCNMCG